MIRNPFKTLLYFLPALVWMGLIFYFSSLSGGESSSQSDIFVYSIKNIFGLGQNFTHIIIVLVRKSAHILEYLILTLLLIFGFQTVDLNINKNIPSGITAYFYAVFDEFHQSFSFERSAQFSDTLIDLIGIILAIVLMKVIQYFRKN